jgi:hypothetical protein
VHPAVLAVQAATAAEVPLARARRLCRDPALDDLACVARKYPPAADRGVAACAATYGTELIDNFRRHDVPVCGSMAKGGPALACMSRKTHKDNAIETAVCRGRDVAVRYDRIEDGDFPWLAFQPGALAAKCGRRDGAGGLAYMHCLKDWMELGLRVGRAADAHCDVTVREPTFFMTRSGDYSPFALAHDWMNTVTQFAAANISRSAARVVLMDRMTVGFYTPVWQRAFTPRHELLWFPDLREQYRGKTVCYADAHFNIPARLSPLYNDDQCRGSPLLRLFSDFVLDSVGALRTVPAPARFVVTLILRKNYQTGHVIGRRLKNPEALAAALRAVDASVVVNALDYADFDYDQQMNISRSTDLLVGMHGAGLIQMMFQPQHGGVFEFFCPDRPSSNTRYENLARRMGVHYQSFSLQTDDNAVPIGAVAPLLRRVVAAVKQRKLEAAAKADDDGAV